jgi:hypothetical protein
VFPDGLARVVASVVHSGDHRGVLAHPAAREAISLKVGAIIVPSARPARYVRHAFRLAKQVGSPLLVLCSHECRAQDVVDEWKRSRIDVEIVAVDLPSTPLHQMPIFTTSELLNTTAFRRDNDTWLKRNIGLAIARMVGWSGVVFLDDDIRVADPADLRRAVGQLEDPEIDAVGLDVGGFPDNSVVCHANRYTGGVQKTFVGGGALAVPAHKSDSFFPNIYNEDWFFLFGAAGLRRVAMTGKARQRPYDPFADPDRARAEEFGDTMAEGILTLIERGGRLIHADIEFWHRYLRTRRGLIAQIGHKARKSMMDSDRCDRMLASLDAAMEFSLLIEPGLCVEYLRRWIADGTVWRARLAELPTSVSPDVALKTLDLYAASSTWRSWDGPRHESRGEALLFPRGRRLVAGAATLVTSVLASAGQLY